MDWIEFNPQRIQEPGVIVGLIIIIISVLVLIFANNISQKIAAKYSKNVETLTITIKFIALGLAIVGCLVAVLTL